MNLRANLKACVVMSVFLLGMGCATAEGRTIYVDDDGAAEFDNIQAAIDDSNNGDTIIVRDGTYTGGGNRDIDFLGKAITVRSENGPENCIIDCNGTEAEPHRGFYFHSGEDSNSVLDGFTITNGYAVGHGGGIYCYEGSPTIRNCIITGNTSYNGGGGGIRAAGGVITNCTFSGNSARKGGGISCGSNTTVSNCTISGNTAATGGGGILCTFGPSPFNPTTIENCTIVGNSAGDGGGIGCRWGGDAAISNCTISGNWASSFGGGISSLDSNPTLVNCILWGDSSACGPEISNYCLYPFYVTTISYSDVQGGQGQAYVHPGCTLDWGPGNIDADPCFVRPGYWGDVNDPNIVVEPNDPNAVWIDGDYHLQSAAGRWDPNSETWVIDANTSICIDAGNPGCPLGDEPDDVNNVRINMGAYGGTAEASKSPANWALLADLTNDRTVDFNDLGVFVDYWLETGQCIPSDLNRSQSVDFVDFAIMALHWLRTSFVESIFDFAVATKGALNLQGNIEIGGASIFIDASVYIESRNDPNALDIIGNSHIAGDVFIINPDATVTLQGGQASIGGETAPEAYDHVFTGVPPTEFPVPEPNYFKHYVENTYDPNNVLAEYDNVIIPAGTNPSFGTVTFRGVVFIEAPNIVTFAGNTTITGIIVGNGDLSDNSGTNQICFTGTVDSYPVTDLPEEFGELRDETGTFLMAPGFNVSFSGNFETLNGAIAANGIEFFGNAGGTIDGSVLNYSNEPMTLSGNSDLFFNRSGTAQMPAGFD